MNLEERNERGGAFGSFKATLHLGMGAVYIVVGCLVLYVKYFGTMELSTGLAYSIGTLMLLYGVFRIWRGIVAVKENKVRR
jgi:uncharacterized membrane protein HdeD (DUF308 family)